MKLSRLIWIAAAGLALAACNTKEQTTPSKPDDGGQEPEEPTSEVVAKTFTGVLENTGETGLTVEWAATDAIGVYGTAATPARFKADAAGKDCSTTFTGRIAKTDNYLAVYPYSRTYTFTDGAISAEIPATQAVVAGSYAKDLNVSLAKAKDDVFNFKGISAILKLTVTAEGLSSAVLKAAGEGAAIAGKLTATLGDNDVTVAVSEGTDAINISGLAGDGQPVYLLVLPGTYEGFTLTLTNTARKSLEIPLEGLTAERGKVSTLEAVVLTEEDWKDGSDEPEPVDDGLDVVLNGHQEVVDWVAGQGEDRIEVRNLTLMGRGVTSEDWASVVAKVSAVTGTFTLDGVGTDNESDWFDTEGKLNGFKLQGSVVFKDIVNIINPSGFKYYSKIDGDLIIEGCPHFCLDWGVGSGIDGLEEVGGTLKISGAGNMGASTLDKLARVGGDLIIENTTGFWFLWSNGLGEGDKAKANDLTSIGGSLVLQNNKVFWALNSFDTLTHIGGDVIIWNNGREIPVQTGNSEGQWRVGYCLVKEWIEDGVVSPSATIKLGTEAKPVDVATLKRCGEGGDEPGPGPEPGDGQDYVLNGHDEIVAFIAGKGAAKETVRNLTIKGADVTEADFRTIDERVAAVTGQLILEELGTSGSWISTDQVLDLIDIRGDLIFRNIPANINPNGTGHKTRFYGDLVVENCPGFPGDWDAFDDCEEIDGNLVIIGMQKGFSTRNLKNLRRVGGNFVFKEMKSFWNFRLQNLTYIGGDLQIIDCTQFGEGEALDGFQNLTHLGGDVLLQNVSGWLPLVTDGNRIGACIFVDYAKNGVMRSDASITVVKDGKTYLKEDIGSCTTEPDQPVTPSEDGDYVIEGHTQLTAFIQGKGATKETVRNLTIRGADITEGDFRSLDERVAAVTGTLLVENVGTADMWLSTDQVLENISLGGSIIFRNIPGNVNPNGMQGITRIDGDLTIENCPKWPSGGGWHTLDNLTEVTGNVTVIGPWENGNNRGFNSDFFPKLEKIGGNFTIKNVPYRGWDYRSTALREIGGNLEIIDCTYWENFYGFHQLRKLGGNVTIDKNKGYALDVIGNAWLPGEDWNLDGKKVGLVIFQVYKKLGIFKGTFHSVVYRESDGGFGYDLAWYDTKAQEIIDSGYFNN